MKRIITLCIFAMALSSVASAFSTKYHATVAYIAEQHMTPKARANFLKAFDNHHLVEFSSYPDFYRSIYNIDGKEIPHVIFLDEDMQPRTTIDEGRYSAYESILWAYDKLQDYRNLDDSTRVFAIALLSHFVGDSHCPGHKNYTDKRVHKVKNVIYKGKEVGYHYFWDSFCMDQKYSGGFMEMAYMIDTCSEKEIRAIQQGSVADWMHSTSVDCAELYDVPDGAEVDRVYITDKAALCAIQVRNAGYRLAVLMNRIFGK